MQPDNAVTLRLQSKRLVLIPYQESYLQNFFARCPAYASAFLRNWRSH